MKAVIHDRVRVSSSQVEVPAPVPADLLDALRVVDAAAEWVGVDLASVSNDEQTMRGLGELLLERHRPVEGLREAWSVQDAMDQWGVERRDPSSFVFPDEESEEAAPVREWYDPLLTVQQAAKRHQVTQQAVRLWVAKKLLEPVMRVRGPRGSIMQAFRASEVDAVAAAQRSRRTSVGVSREQEER